MSGLYIHIPFCVKKCKYCDFNSYSGLEKLHKAYFECLETEIKKLNESGEVFDTVYIGGGTPTAPKNDYLTSLIKTIGGRTPECEITVECNPGTVTLSELENIRAAGVNRLSIGLQSTDDRELKMLGRIHTLSEFEDCFYNARRAGFDNISIDIMFGLPNQTLDSFKKTLEKVVGYKSEHISCYALKIEEGTPFASMKLKLPNDDESADMYDFCVSFLRENGYMQYEISNFAKENKISKHNTKYWLLDEYIGIGAGAHSFYKGKRFFKTCDVGEYVKQISCGGDGTEYSETVTEGEKMSEFVFLGLRMTSGIEETKFFKLFGRSVDDIFGKQILKYVNLGVMERKNGRIFIKPEFLYVSNTILSDFV